MHITTLIILDKSNEVIIFQNKLFGVGFFKKLIL